MSAQRLTRLASTAGGGDTDQPPELQLTGTENSSVPGEILTLGARAYDAYRVFQSARMRAYRHLHMAAPDAVIPPVGGVNAARIYYVQLPVPGCSQCHLAQTTLEHAEYVMAFSQLPFMCWHELTVTALKIESRLRSPAVTLPLQLVRVEMPTDSISSAGSVTMERLNADMARLNAQARTAMEYFARLEDETYRRGVRLTEIPELDAPQILRMRTLIETEAEDARLDLQTRIDSLAGDLASGAMSGAHGGARQREANLPWDLAGLLGAPLQGRGLERVRVSMEEMQRPVSRTSSSGLTPIGERRLIVDGLEGESVLTPSPLQSPERLRMDTRSGARERRNDNTSNLTMVPTPGDETPGTGEENVLNADTLVDTAQEENNTGGETQGDQQPTEAQLAEQQERDRLAREQAEAERVRREQQERDRLATEQANAERVRQEQEQARLEAERLAREQEQRQTALEQQRQERDRIE